MVNLNKGGRIDLSKAAPGLKELVLQLRWKANPFDSGAKFDIDASAFVCKKIQDPADPNLRKSVLVDDQHFVFYNNLQAPNGSVVHGGDDTDGTRGGEDVTVHLDKLEAQVEEIALIVTIYDPSGKMNFGQASDSYVALVNKETNEVIGRYDLEASFSSQTAVQFGSLLKVGDAWQFKAVGDGFNVGLSAFVQSFGAVVGKDQ